MSPSDDYRPYRPYIFTFEKSVASNGYDFAIEELLSYFIRDDDLLKRILSHKNKK